MGMKNVSEKSYWQNILEKVQNPENSKFEWFLSCNFYNICSKRFQHNQQKIKLIYALIDIRYWSKIILLVYWLYPFLKQLVYTALYHKKKSFWSKNYTNTCLAVSLVRIFLFCSKLINKLPNWPSTLSPAMRLQLTGFFFTFYFLASYKLYGG